MTIDVPPDDVIYGDERSVVVIGDSSVARDAGVSAARHANLRIVDSVPFMAAESVLPRTVDVIMVETAGADLPAAEGALKAIDLIARDRDIDVVVAMADDQIDMVVGQLFGRHAQLLCSPSVADRIVALHWARGYCGGRLHDSARDADERLRLLNAEVTRFTETLSRLADARDAPRVGQVRDAAIGFRADPTVPPPGTTDAGTVRDVIRARRLRTSFFPDDLFADPAWDMLLDLFAADLEHRRVSVSSLCIAAAVPGTTALRWIGSMVEAQLLERLADPHDRRRAHISLSARAREGMERYFGAVRRAGLSPA